MTRRILSINPKYSGRRDRVIDLTKGAGRIAAKPKARERKRPKAIGSHHNPTKQDRAKARPARFRSMPWRKIRHGWQISWTTAKHGRRSSVSAV